MCRLSKGSAFVARMKNGRHADVLATHVESGGLKIPMSDDELRRAVADHFGNQGSFFSCPAAVISTSYVLITRICANTIKHSDTITLRLGAENICWSHGMMLLEDSPENTFKVDPHLVEATDKYGILEVFGNPSSAFGMVHLLDRNPKVGERIFAIYGLDTPIIKNCTITSLTTDSPDPTQEFTYKCNPRRGGVADNGWVFLFANDGSGLVGITDLFREDSNKTIAKAASAAGIRTGYHPPVVGQSMAAASQEIQALNAKANDLKGRRRFWEEQVFQYKSGNYIYPSKNDSVYDPKRRYDPKIPKMG
jgi:hypothetical protein